MIFVFISYWAGWGLNRETDGQERALLSHVGLAPFVWSETTQPASPFPRLQSSSSLKLRFLPL